MSVDDEPRGRTGPRASPGHPGGAPDAVVVGGGVAGLGVAWRLAQRGLRTVVADESPGSGASHVAAGMIAPITETSYGEEDLLDLNRASASRWPAFAAELEEASGLPVGYRDDGTLVVGFDADDLRALLDVVGFQEELGLEVERLRSRACREREPALAPGVRGGAFVPGDHQVDNRSATAALLAAATATGVQLRREAVASIEVSGGRATGVVLRGGERVPAGTVVLAAGCWSGRVEGIPAEAVPPVRPVKGQILRLRGPATMPVLERTVRAVVRGASLYLVPRRDGELVVGSTVEEQGFDTTVTAGGVHDLLRDAVDIVPGVAELELAEALAGLRPGTPDNAPLLGPTAVDGLVLATGHYRHGFLLLPVTADEVAATVAGDAADPVVGPFSPQRFVGAAA